MKAGKVINWGSTVVMLVIAGPFLIISLLCIVSGIFCISFDMKLMMKCKDKVEAVVSDIYVDKDSFTGKDSEGNAYSFDTEGAYFTFTYKGNEYTAKSKISSNEKIYTVGETVKLRVNPKDPTEVYCPKDKSSFKTGLSFFGTGGFILVLVYFAVIRKYILFNKAVKESFEPEPDEYSGGDI